MKLETRDLSFSYTGDSPVLQSVSGEIQPGSFLAILGMNGSGKSTLLSCLNAMLAPGRGSVLLDGRELTEIKRRERARDIALVTQHSHANRLTVFDTLLLGRKPFMEAGPSEEDENIVTDVLEEMNLGEYALRYVDELSGGEYQKVILARAFVQHTPILLLDEPTNNLDPANQHEVLQAVRDAVSKRDLAAAAVMHDVNSSLRYCDRFMLIKEGSVVACGDADIITPEALEDVFGVPVDILEHKGRKVIVPR